MTPNLEGPRFPLVVSPDCFGAFFMPFCGWDEGRRMDDAEAPCLQAARCGHHPMESMQQ